MPESFEIFFDTVVFLPTVTVLALLNLLEALYCTSGTKTLYFTIKPKATRISSLKAGSKKFTVKWNKQATQTTGYQVQVATNKKFKKNKKTVTIKKQKTTKTTVKKLKAKKKYYVRVRTYKTVKINGKSIRIYSGWSKAKTVTTKK